MMRVVKKVWKIIAILTLVNILAMGVSLPTVAVQDEATPSMSQPTPTDQSITRQIAIGTDDCYTFGAPWPPTIRLVRDYLFIDNCWNYIQSYLRFTDIDIPQGASITYAYLDLCSHERNGGRSLLTIHGIKEPNTNTFSTQPDADGRPLTNTVVEWEMSGEYPGSQIWEDGVWYDKEVTSLVQEIVDQSLWHSGNSLAIRIGNIELSGNARVISSFEYGDGSYAAKLYITFTTEGEPPPIGLQGTVIGKCEFEDGNGIIIKFPDGTDISSLTIGDSVDVIKK